MEIPGNSQCTERHPDQDYNFTVADEMTVYEEYAAAVEATQYSEYLQVPSATVSLEQAKREAVMSYCAEQRQPLSELIEGADLSACNGAG